MDKVIEALVQAIFAVLVADAATLPVIAKFREKIRVGEPDKLALQVAILRAYSAFAEKFPGLANDLYFDKIFLKQQEVAAELAKLLIPGQQPDRQHLETLWKAQISSTLQFDLAEPLAFFLDTLATEIKAQPALKPFIDSRALEDLVHLGGAEVGLLQEIRDLLKQIASQRADAAENRPAATSAVHITDPDDVPERAPKLFGREDLLAQIAAGLTGNDPLLLQGFSGMGKTALAAQAVYDWLKAGKGNALWLKAGSAPAEEIFQALARPFGTSQALAAQTGDALLQTVRTMLRETGIKLLVLDDCWNAKALTTVLKAVPSDLPVLLTARREYGIRQTLKVDVLAPDQALKLLGFHANQNFTDDPAARELCKQLGYLPFALRIAGINLQKQYHLKPAELSLKIKNTAHELKAPLDFAEDGHENVASLLKISLDALDAEARAVFIACGAFFAPTITPEMMGLYVGTQHVASSSVTAPEKSLTTLAHHGLIEHIPSTEKAVAHYRLHDLAYSYARAQNGETEHHRALDACLAYLKGYNQPSLANFAALRPELPNLLAAADWAFAAGRYADVETFVWF